MIPDISHWHPVQNWSQLKKNCSFVISKATEGTSYIDPTLFSFIRNCEAYQIPYYLYSFLRPGNEVGQAQYLIKVCKSHVGKYFRGYVLDVESGNSAAAVSQALKWLEKNTSHKCILYMMYAEYKYYARVIANRAAKTAWWEARYGRDNGVYSPSYPSHPGADLHQFTSKGYQPGVGSGTDLNRLTGTKPLSWFIGTTAKKETKKKASSDTKKIPTLEETRKLAYQTLRGKYGQGEKRKAALGWKYTAVQEFINHIKAASIETLAQETIKGVYGKGLVRRKLLGSKYRDVQRRVNQLMR